MTTSYSSIQVYRIEEQQTYILIIWTFLCREYLRSRTHSRHRYSEIRLFRIEKQQHNVRTSSGFQVQRNYHWRAYSLHRYSEPSGEEHRLRMGRVIDVRN